MDETFKVNVEGGENHVEETTQVDEKKDDLDQDCDKRQANVANNKDDQCCDKNVTITNIQRIDIITKTAIKSIKGSNYNIYQTQDKTGVLISIISTGSPFKGTDTKCVGDNNTKTKVAMYIEHVQLTTNVVKRSNQTSRKSVNKASPSSYLLQIPRHDNQNEAMVIIKIAPLKSSVRHRARIKHDIRKYLSFEDKAPLNGEAM